MSKELEKIILEYIGNDSDMSEFIFFRQMSDIIINTKIPSVSLKYRHKMDKKTAINHAISFLNTIDKKYGDKLKDIISKNIINFNAEKCYVDLKNNGEKEFNISLENNINDSYSITHEFFHYDNLTPNSIGVDVDANWHLMTETISILSELLQTEYFKNKHIKDYQNCEIDTLITLKIKAYQLSFKLDLIEYCIQNEYIDYRNIINSYPNWVLDFIIDNILNDLNNQEYDIDLLVRYVAGGVLSSYMFSRIQHNKKNINELIELQDNMNDMSFYDTLTYLDLNMENDVFDLESIKVLNKAYKDRVRQVWK